MGEGKIGLERGGRKKKEDKEDNKPAAKGRGKAKVDAMDEDDDLDDVDDE